MAYLSVRHIEVPKSLGTDKLYYGYSSTADLPRTPLAVIDELKPLMLKAYGDDEEEHIDEVVDWSLTQRPVANLSRSSVLNAQKAVVAFYRGEDAPIEQKRALDGLVDFSSHAIGASQILYIDLNKGQIANAVDRVGLAGEAAEVAAEDGASTFISDRVAYPTYGLDVFNDANIGSDGRKMALENMEGRRVVASTHALLYFSLGVGALYAQHVNHKDNWAGIVANQMNPLIGI